MNKQCLHKLRVREHKKKDKTLDGKPAFGIVVWS
jgi:hypothetical protein